MSRSQRLLNLIQALRCHRYPVSGAKLAAEMGISLRTLYRDIATLQAQGANIEGEAGIGYVLGPGYMLPPLMFSEDEIEALALGSRWVADRGDAALSAAARNALAKISAVLPAKLQDVTAASALVVGPGKYAPDETLALSTIRKAIHSECKTEICYRDLKGAESIRTIWPLAISFFDSVQIVVGWCELRGTFRHFRMDRISMPVISAQRYPRRRQGLLREWRKLEGIPPQ